MALAARLKPRPPQTDHALPKTDLRNRLEGQELVGRHAHFCLLWRLECNKLTRMNEIIFEVTQEADDGFVAECLTESIFTQADSWEELRANVKEAVAAFYFDQPQRPAPIRLHLVRDEVLA